MRRILNKFYIIRMPAYKRRIKTVQYFTPELFAAGVLPGVCPFVFGWQAVWMKSELMADKNKQDKLVNTLCEEKFEEVLSF